MARQIAATRQTSRIAWAERNRTDSLSRASVSTSCFFVFTVGGFVCRAQVDSLGILSFILYIYEITHSRIASYLIKQV